MSEYSMQYACSPLTGDYGPLSVENLAMGRLLLGNMNITDSGVIFWRDSTYVPQVGTIAAAVNGLLEPSESGGVVSIASGVGMVNGYLYLNDDTVDFDIDSNPGNAGATDRIVLRWDYNAQTVRLVRLAGAIGNTAVLTQNATVWDTPIARVQLDGGAGEFLALIDDRKLIVPTGTLMKIDEAEGDGANDTITFLVPPLFTHLIIKGVARSDQATDTAQLRLTFNGDVGANYAHSIVRGFNSTVTNDENEGTTDIDLGSIVGDSSPAGAVAHVVVDINNYKDATLKMVNFQNAYKDYGVVSPFRPVHKTGSGFWDDNDPITSIELVTDTSFHTLTKISLYGVV